MFVNENPDSKKNSFLQLYFKEKYDTQQTQNVVTMFVVRSQRRKNNAHSSDADATTSKLQSCFNVTSVLDSKFMSK